MIEIRIRDIKPIPWKAPGSKSGFKKSTGAKYTVHYQDKNLKAFQSILKDHFTKWADGRFRPLSGPIELRITIYRKTEDSSLWGRWAYKEKSEDAKGFGDLRNICKAIEDSIQGILIKRDSQVCSTYPGDQSIWSSRDEIVISMSELNRNEDVV